MKTRHGRKICWYSSLMVCLAVFIITTVASAEKEIKIGIIGPMKFRIGEEHWVAANIAAEEINAAGGVKVGDSKYKIELIRGDTNELLSITDAVSTVEKLITVNKVKFIVGGFKTEAVLAMQEVIADHKVIFLNAYTASPEPPARLTKNYDRFKYYFKVAVINSKHMAKVFFNEASMVADKVRGAMDIAKPRVALLAEKLLWVDPLVELARSRFPAMGMEIVGIWRPSPTATDVTAELSAIKNADAHMIFLLSAGPVGSVISKQWGELQIPAALHGANPSSDSDRHWEITGGLCNYEASHTVFGEAELTPRTIPFIKKMKGRYGYTPTPSGTLYDAIYVLKDALERAGTLDTDAMITALEKTDYAGAFGRIAFTPKDDPEWPHDIRFGPNYITGLVTQWRDGKQLVVWPDGKPLLGDKSWVGIKYKGTVEYELPPWVVKYWKGRK